MNFLFNGNASDVMKSSEYLNIVSGRRFCIVTDPPFNVGYHYATYKDNMNEADYYEMLADIFKVDPFVVVHYPEQICRLSIETGRTPEKIVSWVYNSNTAKQHRDIAFYGVRPDFRKVTQPYKNPNDKRIQKLIAKGRTGARLYDWWNVNQVKNVSSEKTDHPCQMPEEVMDNAIGILPEEIDLIIDPFMGSGTTGVSAQKLGLDFVGIELDENYFKIARERLEAQK